MFGINYNFVEVSEESQELMPCPASYLLYIVAGPELDRSRKLTSVFP